MLPIIPIEIFRLPFSCGVLNAEEFAEEKFMLFKNNFVINPVAVKKMIEKTATKGSILKMRFI